MEEQKVGTEFLVRKFLEQEIEELPHLTFIHLDSLDSIGEHQRGLRQYVNGLHQRLMRYVSSQYRIKVIKIQEN